MTDNRMILGHLAGLIGLAAFSFLGIEILDGWSWQGVVGTLVGIVGIGLYVRLTARHDSNTMRSPFGWATAAAVATILVLLALQRYGSLPEFSPGLSLFIVMLVFAITAAAVRAGQASARGRAQ